MASWLKEQLDAVGRKMERWPEWEKKQLNAEIERTPLRSTENDPGDSSNDKTVASPNDSIGRTIENAGFQVAVVRLLAAALRRGPREETRVPDAAEISLIICCYAQLCLQTPCASQRWSAALVTR